MTSLFSEAPMFFTEDPEADVARLKQLQSDDPIAWQDALNTSRAVVEAVKENDIEELRRVVANAEQGELIQAFTIQSFFLALKASSLEMVQQFVDWGMPLQSASLSQVLHLVCEMVSRENFSNSWRILKVLADGNAYGGIDINTPRSSDGWTPLCIACAGACLPLAFKLLELKADPNVITRSNETPLSLAKRAQPEDNEEQREARGIISNMLRSYGAQDNYKDVLRISRKQAKEINVASEPVSKSHTRYRG
mmetsp:Transcript_43622/g.69217  ORF Transcript_43622/g.69217 Transcript_43622/m.69217 type:complete len:251 (+) Transcript_43622:87-839(+)